MKKAAEYQVNGTIPALLALKRELGDEWENTYVIIPTVWPVAKINTRLQVFSKVMSIKQMKERILIIEGAKGEDDAQIQLGRIISDRTLAQLAWGGSTDKDSLDHIYSLSTKRDLLCTFTERAMDIFCGNIKSGDLGPCHESVGHSYTL